MGVVIADSLAGESWPELRHLAELPPDLDEPPVGDLDDDVDGVPLVASWAAVDLAGYLDGSYRPPTPTLLVRADGHALLYPGLTHSLHGESESGKSWVAQAEAVRVIADGGRVLYLDFESDPASVIERLRALGAAADAIISGFVYVNPETNPYASHAGDREAWRGILAQRFDLAVIDGVTAAVAAFGARTKENDDLTAWARQFPDRLARQTGAAVVAIDHVTKDPESRGRFAIGGQAKMAAITGAAYTVEATAQLGRGLRGVIVLRVAKDRPGYVRAQVGAWRQRDHTAEAARIVIDSTGPHVVVTIEPPKTDAEHGGTPWRPTALMEKLSRALEAAAEPPSLRAATALVTGQNDAKRQALDELVKAGHVSVTTGPRGARLHAVASPYRQADDPESDAYEPGHGQHPEAPSTTVPTVPRVYTPGHGAQSFDCARGTVGHGGGTVESASAQEVLS